LAGVELGEGGYVARDGLLHGDAQVAGIGLADRQLAALGQGLAGAGLHGGLAPVGLGQLQQQLEVLTDLAQRQYLCLRGLARGEQGRLGLQQLEQFAGHRRAARLGVGQGLRAKAVDFACHHVATCGNSPLCSRTCHV
uniref:Tektin n=1 Tax=Steinernema glaseri TaxID=37863 RepID=A0A1I8ADW8_9BILA